jgi:acylphosphatase
MPLRKSVNSLRMKHRIARRYLISGRVQGVGFRYFAERVATEIGVTGWARNLSDGRVEVHANGTVPQLNDFEARLRKGPAYADVRGFEVVEDAPTDSSEFRIR